MFKSNSAENQQSAIGNQGIGSGVIKTNVFLRRIIDNLDHGVEPSQEELTSLQEIFQAPKNFKSLEKYLYQVTISLGMSHRPPLVALAREFNEKLNSRNY